jgi:hypothetical protein
MPTISVRPIEAGQISYVEWGPIIAGAIAAIAVSFVLFAFGSAIGLTAISPWGVSSSGLKAIGLGGAIWFLLVVLWSFALGGYLAGRMRHPVGDASPDEISFRDGAHGFLVWALGVFLAAGLATSGLTLLGGTLLVSDKNAPAALNPVSVATDDMLRPSQPGKPVATERRDEVTRILTRSGKNAEVSPPDRAYLVSLTSAETGLAAPEADKRVSDVLNAMKDSLDRARRVAVVLGFLAASILLVGAAIAWWAAKVGGRHREEGSMWWGFARPRL